MNEIVTHEGSSLGFTIAAVLYLWFVYFLARLEKQKSLNRKASDEEYLYRMAKAKSCSEYEIFKQATVDWSVSDQRVDEDFRKYLLNGILPFYVRSYIRNHKKDVVDKYSPMIFPGGKLPPSWSA